MATYSDVSFNLQDIFPFVSLTDQELGALYASLDSLSFADLPNIQFNIPIKDKYLDRISPTITDCNILEEVDIRNSVKCKYLTLQECKIPCVKDYHNTKLVHLNVRSLPSHLEELEATLDILGRPPIVGLCETWLKESNKQLYSPPGYHIVAKSRYQRTGGGVALLFDANLNYKIRTDLNLSQGDQVEAVFADITIDKSKIITVGEIYQPPSASVHDFIVELAKLLDNLENSRVPSYLMGDFNIDLLKHPTNNYAADLVHTLASHSFVPLVSKPTRLSSSSISLIDNIFSNHLRAHSVSSTFLYDSSISDHLLVLHIIESLPISRKPMATKGYYRINDANLAKFAESMSRTPWDRISSISDPNLAFNALYDRTIQCFHQSFPKRMPNAEGDKEINHG